MYPKSHRKSFGPGLELWAVVNNAGIAVNTPIEWGFDIKELNKIFSVNVFGAVRVAKLSIPLLRKSNGRVINVSSLAGMTGFIQKNKIQ